MSLDDMVQTLAEQLDGPVVLYDADLNLVAFSVHGDDVDEARRSVILSRRASARAQEMIAAHQVGKAHSPVRLPPHEGTPARVIYPIWRDRFVVGYIAYIDGDPDGELEPHHEWVLSAAEDEIGTMLALRSLQHRQSSGDARRLLTDLLSEDPACRAAAAEELLEAGLLSSAARYAVMVFRPAHSPARSTGSAARFMSGPRLAIEQALATIVRSTSLKACGAVIGDEGVLVIPRPVNPERLASLLRRPGLESLRAGAGRACESLTQVRESHREAVLAWRAATADPARYGPSAHWDALGLDRLLVQLPLDSLTADDLPPTVRRLLEAPSGEKLARTLEAYLDNGADAQLTARVLVIHRSTLYYRLGRIHEIVQSDLSDGQVRRELHTGLRVATLAGLRVA
ncbi:PucR family transcriptional regulator [Streptosporangium carneum]|uniref:Transcriptional regulator n=1 Tax=Streptosporangium carneum TaxID=47481 RepID=A0A9W6I524_9ACTN|nr:helix-turn-helix domain-containing protein [Streptosporangium carneum]GLK11354.1 transcriptional regulator [Streptosporangium carneum]